MSDEWGPWIEHDGEGCPCEGVLSEWQFCPPYPGPVGETDHKGNSIIAPNTVLGVPEGGGAWLWYPGFYHIIRYRIRKPRALEQLREIAADPERELEEA